MCYYEKMRARGVNKFKKMKKKIQRVINIFIKRSKLKDKYDIKNCYHAL